VAITRLPEFGTSYYVLFVLISLQVCMVELSYNNLSVCNTSAVMYTCCGNK